MRVNSEGDRSRTSGLAPLALALLSVWAVACGDGATEPGPAPTPANRAPTASGSIPAVTVGVGEAATVDVAGYFTDPDGDALTFAASSSSTATVSVSVSGSMVTVTGVASGTATVTVTATDPGGLSAQQGFQVVVPNQAPVLVDSLPARTMFVGDTAEVDVAAYFTDADGDALTYATTSSNEATVTVSMAGSVVSLAAIAQGSAVVTVTATDPGGLSAEQASEVTVPNRAPLVRDSIQSRSLDIDQAESWSALDLFRDPDGDSLTYVAGSSDSQVVRPWVMYDSLRIQGISPGTATIAFSAIDPEGLSARIAFDVTVSAPGDVSITGTEPSVLLEGATATIFGSGFRTLAALNRVSIGGLPASVTAATGTSLTIEVPQADCLPARRVELRVTVGSQSDSRTVGVAPMSQEDLDLRQGWYRFAHAGNGCLHLPGDAGGGDYLIGVVSTSEDASILTPVAMTSTVGDATVVAAGQPLVAASRPPQTDMVEAGSLRPGSLAPAARVQGGTEAPRRQEEVGPRQDWGRQAEMTERNLTLARRLGPSTARSIAGAGQGFALAANDTLSLFAGYYGTCSASDQVRAVVRRVGDYAVWLDDIENPSAPLTDDELAGLDAFYGTHARAVHEDYFGGPSDIDGNSRVLILMTKEVNRQDGDESFFGGWVWFGDLYPSDQCATSNQAEIVYARVPDPDGVFGHAWTKEDILDYYPSLLTHEITHLAQGNAYVFGNADFTIWELEGGATLSEQLVAYGLFGHGSGRDLGYEAYDRGRDWYQAWVEGLARFFGWDSDDRTNSRRVANAPEECSWTGGPEEGNSGPCKVAFRAVNDVPSVVFRYAMDRWGRDYPGGEQALMRRLTQSPHRGLAALEEVSGWPAERILADFYVSLWLDLNGGRAYGMATWDLDDIWAQFVESAQLRPYTTSFAQFYGDWRIRGGSTFYLRWTPSGSRGPTALKVRSTLGRFTPDYVSVWAYRIR